MGVIYKLLPKIKAFIIEQKKKEPRLSCRKASSLILQKFQIKISKSSINSLLKQTGLSSPVGRRRKKRRSLKEAEGLGSLLLKAADLLLGGSAGINQAIKDKLPKSENASLLEGLLYLPLFLSAGAKELPPESALWPLTGKQHSYQALTSYLNDLQGVKALGPEIFQAISDAFKETYCLKLTLTDNSIFYLDGQLRTIWSTPHIPSDFSTTLYKTKSYIENYAQENAPLILFTAPGYDLPTKEFFDFLLAQEGAKLRMVKATFYGNKMEELDSRLIPGQEKKYYILGIWPWQFEKYRVVNLGPGTKSVYLEPQEKEYYFTEAGITLTQPKTNQRVTLRSCVIKLSAAGKASLLIATNIPAEKVPSEEIVRLYISRWPNIEAGFLEFSRKIELFTYTASSRNVLSTDGLVLAEYQQQDIRGLLNAYLQGLDLYLRSRIFPVEYEKLTFSTMKERFYDLKAKIKARQDCQIVSFILPKEYPFRKDLVYACCRLNEKEIILADKKRLWFDII